MSTAKSSAGGLGVTVRLRMTALASWLQGQVHKMCEGKTARRVRPRCRSLALARTLTPAPSACISPPLSGFAREAHPGFAEVSGICRLLPQGSGRGGHHFRPLKGLRCRSAFRPNINRSPSWRKPVGPSGLAAQRARLTVPSSTATPQGQDLRLRLHLRASKAQGYYGSITDKSFHRSTPRPPRQGDPARI